MSIAWHFVITNTAEVVPVAELRRRPDVVAELRGVVRAAIVEQTRASFDRLMEGLAPIGAAAVEALRQFAEVMNEFGRQLVEAFRPVAEAMSTLARAWWRSLPPHVRAWLRRRHHYGGSPVTGPPRWGLFAAPVRRL